MFFTEATEVEVKAIVAAMISLDLLSEEEICTYVLPSNSRLLLFPTKKSHYFPYLCVKNKEGRRSDGDTPKNLAKKCGFSCTFTSRRSGGGNPRSCLHIEKKYLAKE
ncbi:unnamed protein product, partial [Callosobruchus maculatus]